MPQTVISRVLFIPNNWFHTFQGGAVVTQGDPYHNTVLGVTTLIVMGLRPSGMLEVSYALELSISLRATLVGLDPIDQLTSCKGFDPKNESD